MGKVINMRERRIMTEFDGGKYQEDTERVALPGMELHEIVESMSPAERLEYKTKLLSEIDDREKLVWLINEVNEVEGIDV